MKYTIIVTVYNKEKYLDRCLETICNQTYNNYSIIIVNDGSTDNSEDIIKKYQKNCKIDYYKKENTGIADTRNFAIQKVKTPYFLFVDADDYIALDLIENIDKYDDYDLLSFNSINVNENLQILKKMDKPKFKGTGEEFFTNLVKGKTEFTVPWGYVYNTEYFKKSRFLYPKGRILEDYYLTPTIIIESKNVISIDYTGYFYVTNKNSIVNDKKNKEIIKDTYFYYFEQLNNKIDASQYSDNVKKTYKNFLANILIWYGSTLEDAEQREYIKMVKQKKVKIPNKLKAILYKMNLYYKVRRMGKKVTDNKIISNYIYTVLYQLVIILGPLITIPYKSRILGPNNMGIYNYVLSVYSLLLMSGTLGINIYGRREVAYVKDDKYKRSKILYELIILKFITIILTIIAFAFFVKSQINYINFYLIMLLDILFNIFDFTWFYQGIEQLKKISLVNIIIKILNVVCTFIFIKSSDDLINYFILTLITDISIIIILWSSIRAHIQKVKIKELKVFKHLKNCIILFIPQVFINIYTVCDKIMLGNLSSSIAEVGFYENSNKIVRISLTIISAIIMVMVPIISNEFKNKNKENIKHYMNRSAEFVLFLGIPLTIGIIGIAKNLVLILFGEQYVQMIKIIRNMALMIIPIGLTSIIGEQYLISTKQEKRFTIYIAIGAITNIILNIILIPKYLALGTAIATVITEWIVLIIELPVIQKVINLKHIIWKFIKYLFCSLLMLIIITFIGSIGTGFGILFCQIIIGIAVYGTILLILHDKNIKTMTNFIKE